MHGAVPYDAELHAVVDHQLDDEGLRAALARLLADPDATARCADYSAQCEALSALREGLTLRVPEPSLADLTEELHAVVQHQNHMRITMAVGGVMALMAVVGYASWPGQSREPTS